MKSKSRKKKIIIAVIALIPIIIISSIISPFIIVPMHNDLKLESFANQLFNYPLPPSSVLVSKHKDVGNLSGTGNHCNFLAAMVISSRLKEEDINKYYSKLKISQAKGKYGHKVEVEIFIKDKVETNPYGVYIETIDSKDREFSKEDGEKIEYVIQIYDPGYPPSFDFRCH